MITGATGTVGQALVNELIRTRVPAKALVRRIRRNPEWDLARIEQVRGDMESVDALADAFEGVNRLFALSPPGDRIAALGKNIIDAARTAGVRFIVRLSAYGADSGEVSLAAMHGEADRHLEASGIPYAILRPVPFMQNFLMHAETIRERGELSLPLGDGRVAYIDVRDIAACAASVLTQSGHNGKIYHLTGPEALSGQDIARIITAQTGRGIRYVDSPEEKAERAMLASGTPPGMAKALAELYRAEKAGKYSALSPVPPALLGREPLTFSQFVRDHLAEFSGVGLRKAS